MKSSKYIAHRKFISVSKEGTRKTVTVAIGLPYECGHEEWACPVGLEGLYQNLMDAHGADSFQALMLALKLTRSLLQSFIDKGGNLLDEYEEEKVDLEKVFTTGEF